MELNQVLERLDYTIEKAKGLKLNQFNYSEYVSKFDFENNCGTVCCIAGHYPNWNIEGFVYLNYSLHSIPSLYIIDALSDYHGLSEDIAYFLFHNYSINSPLFAEFEEILPLEKVTLSYVLERFEFVRKLLASGEITPNQEF